MNLINLISATTVYYDSKISMYAKGSKIVINTNYIVSVMDKEDLFVKLPKTPGIGRIYIVNTVIDNMGNSLTVCGENMDIVFGGFL